MPTDRLSALQRDLVRALAPRNTGFFLTGGGVLVGFVLGHRTTDDLALFTTDYCLEQAGHRVEDHLDNALRKDAGATPATIAWLLSTLRVPERLPGDVPRDAILAYVKELEARLRKRAFPPTGGAGNAVP